MCGPFVITARIHYWCVRSRSWWLDKVAFLQNSTKGTNTLITSREAKGCLWCPLAYQSACWPPGLCALSGLCLAHLFSLPLLLSSCLSPVMTGPVSWPCSVYSFLSALDSSDACMVLLLTSTIKTFHRTLEQSCLQFTHGRPGIPPPQKKKSTENLNDGF